MVSIYFKKSNEVEITNKKADDSENEQSESEEEQQQQPFEIELDEVFINNEKTNKSYNLKFTMNFSFSKIKKGQHI